MRQTRFAAALVIAGFAAWPLAAAELKPSGGRQAVSFQLKDLSGTSHRLADYRGQVVLVNFWATWCPPCRIEMPGFQRVYEDRRDEGFVVVGISTDQAGVGVVREFLAKRDITFPVAMATGQVVQDFGGVRALPTSFLIDREGRIRQEVKGFFAEPALRMAVRHLLAEGASTAATDGGAR